MPRRLGRRRPDRLIRPLAALLLIAGCSAVDGVAAPTGTAPARTGASPGPAASDPGAVEPTAPSTPAPTTDPTSVTPREPTAPATSGGGTPAQPGNDDVVPAPADEQAPGGIGAVGIGDDYYPEAGNGGYQVEDYHLGISYVPETNQLRGTADIALTVTASEALQRFNFDLQSPMKVSAVSIGGTPARFRQQDAELEITPAVPLGAGAGTKVRVVYAGKPTAVNGGTSGLGDGGWYRTRSGGALAVGEPLSASSWFPVNEHPADPASYTLTVTVPSKWKVMGPGVPQKNDLPKAPSGSSVFRWYQQQPVASYLVPLFIDTFTAVTDTSGPIPIYSAIAAGDATDTRLDAGTGRYLQVLQKYFGDYPFDSAGGIYTDESIPFALETASRPVYADWVDEETVIHELAHQWYGDHVLVQRWQDICLNECFASYAPWLYYEDTTDADLDARWKEQMASSGDEVWGIPLIDMGPGQEFTTVYTRGPLAVHALRAEMGETAFLSLLKRWPTEHAGNATFGELQEFAEELSGKDLEQFFQVWFRATTAPPESDYPQSLR